MKELKANKSLAIKTGVVWTIERMTLQVPEAIFFFLKIKARLSFAPKAHLFFPFHGVIHVSSGMASITVKRLKNRLDQCKTK